MSNGERVVRAEWPGVIRAAAKGSNGFGYDPIFSPDGMTGTAAEISDRIRQHWNNQKPELGGIRKAMERSASYQDADPFMDAKGSEREAKARALR